MSLFVSSHNASLILVGVYGLADIKKPRTNLKLIRGLPVFHE